MSKQDQYGNTWSVHYDNQLMHDGRWVVYKNGKRYTSFHSEQEAEDCVNKKCD